MEQETYAKLRETMLGFESTAEAHAAELITTVKKSCVTYKEVGDALLRLKQDAMWDNLPHCISLINAAEKIVDEEKGHLLVAGSP